MDLGTIAQWASAIVAIVSLAMSIWVVATKRNRAEIDELFRLSNEHGGRITKAEADLRHMPDKESVHELKLAMADMKGQMAVIIERVGPIKAIAERLQDVMLEHGK